MTDMNTGIPACDRTYVAHTLEDVFLKFQMGNTTPPARHGAMVAEDLSPVSKEEFNAYRPLLRLALRAGRPIHIPAPNEPEGWALTAFEAINGPEALLFRVSAPDGAVVLTAGVSSGAVCWLVAALHPGLHSWPGAVEWLPDFSRCVASCWHRQRPGALHADPLDDVAGDFPGVPVVDMRRRRMRVTDEVLDVVDGDSLFEQVGDDHGPEAVRGDDEWEPGVAEPALEYGAYGPRSEGPWSKEGRLAAAAAVDQEQIGLYPMVEVEA